MYTSRSTERNVMAGKALETWKFGSSSWSELLAISRFSSTQKTDRDAHQRFEIAMPRADRVLVRAGPAAGGPAVSHLRASRAPRVFWVTCMQSGCEDNTEHTCQGFDMDACPHEFSGKTLMFN